MLEHRASPAILEFCAAENLESLVTRGVATPEHVIHIKRKGVALPAPRADDLAGFKQAGREPRSPPTRQTTAPISSATTRASARKTMLDPSPRAFYVPGVGIFAAGPTAKQARVAADVIEATIEVIAKAEGIGGFEPLSESDLFDLEYWSLEQIKLSKTAEKPLTRQIAVVTGAASGIGLAIAEALRAEGAELALIDLAAAPLEAEARRLGAHGRRLRPHRPRRRRRGVRARSPSASAASTSSPPTPGPHSRAR